MPHGLSACTGPEDAVRFLYRFEFARAGNGQSRAALWPSLLNLPAPDWGLPSNGPCRGAPHAHRLLLFSSLQLSLIRGPDGPCRQRGHIQAFPCRQKIARKGRISPRAPQPDCALLNEMDFCPAYVRAPNAALTWSLRLWPRTGPLQCIEFRPCTARRTAAPHFLQDTACPPRMQCCFTSLRPLRQHRRTFS